jgi:large subunit ribosomal protein L25
MNEKTIKGYKRETLGTGESRRIRREGKIPAVIYGKNAPEHISLDVKEFATAIGSINETSIITIKVGRKSHSVLIKAYQTALISGDVTHMDFFEVSKGETLHTHIPVTLHGSAKGVKEGGLLEHVLHDLEIECLPKDIPESIVVEIAELGMNESLHVSSIVVPEGVKILTNPERTIVTVVSKKAEVTEESEELEGEEEGE